MTQQKRTRQPAKSLGPVGWQDFPIVAYTELDGREVPIRSDKSLDEAEVRALLLLENTMSTKPHKKEVDVAGASE